MQHKIVEPEQKALEINLNRSIYGIFAEIGAGQEVARYFFKVGAAAGTIAKTMSAYDKIISDNIYGVENSGRYVCESRLYKMLDHEYNLLINRLQNELVKAKFFVFADTIAAINYQRTIKGDGWMGLRFRLNPDEEPNDFVLHVRMKDKDNNLQQQAVGILGVNMIYACYHYHDDPQRLIVSLMDNLKDRVEIDMVRLNGPAFEGLDNRILSLWLVLNNMTKLSMFDSDKRPIHASEYLYKKDLLIVRGSFRPPTLVNQDMMKSAWQHFKNQQEPGAKGSMMITEITKENLLKEGNVSVQDFLDRTDALCALGQTVMISSAEDYVATIKYFNDHRVRNIGVVYGVQQLLELISQKYYDNINGSLLAAFGALFSKKVKTYVYPAKQEGSGELMSAQNLQVPEEIKFLYQHLLDNQQIEDIEGINEDVLHIFSPNVLDMIKHDEPGWQSMVPVKVAEVIKQNHLFGFPATKLSFEY